MELLESLGRIAAEEASVANLFAGEGRSARNHPKTAKYQSDLVEAAVFLSEVYTGKRRFWQLQEAMTTDDFPILFGDILDRTTLASYTEAPSSWTAYAARRTVRDFRPAKLYKPLRGADNRLEEVAEDTEYPESKLVEDQPQLISVTKWGRKIPFSFEAMTNDEMDRLKDIPERFGRAAKRTEDYAGTELHVDAAGPKATIYTAGNKNQIITANGASTNNPSLTIAGLQDGFTVLTQMRDDDGEPIVIDMVTLEVPPALEIVAQNILNATALEIDTAAGGGLAGQRLITANWMRNRLNVVVNPLLPMVDKSANVHKTWYLHANPSVGRPAFYMIFLLGHESPEIFIKEPNQRRVGGGTANPMDGDFDTDSITYKVRKFQGTAVVDPKMTAASKGTNA